jgi:hypothetical protein
MIQVLDESLKNLLMTTAKKLKGSDRRKFMAQTVQELGRGGQRRAEAELGWDRETIRKGALELAKGFDCIDAFRARGRKAAEKLLPNLLPDLKAVVDSQSQTDPQFKSKRLYTRLSAAEVRRQLIGQKGYSEEELPTVRTIATKLNQLGYHPSRVQKSKPKKK